MNLRTSHKAVLAAASAVLAVSAVAEPVLWPEHQRAFFQDGPQLLLDDSQRRSLTTMDDESRELFITGFLADPLPETAENELVLGIERRTRLARSEVATPLDDRARLLFLHGSPAAREAIDCGTALVPIEIWSYGPESAELVLYQSPGRRTYRLWRPVDGKRVLYSSLMEGWFEELGDFGQERRRIDVELCKAVLRVDEATGTEGLFDEQARAGLSDILEARLGPPEDLARWSLEASRTPLPDATPRLQVEAVEVDFPFQAGQRVAVRFVATLPAGADLAVTADEDGGEPRIELEVSGLLEYEGRVFEEFKVRFKRRPAAADEPVVLVWDRRLRPQRRFVARLTIRDSGSGATHESVRVLSVPRSVERVVRGGRGGAVPVEDVAAGALGGKDSLVLVPPVTDGLSKAWRAEALVTGDHIRRVVFSVDGKEQLIRTRPPYTADLGLADVPVEQIVTAVGYDRAGEIVAEDRIVLNKARALFRVEIVSPQDPRSARGRVTARAEVSVPDESRLEAVDFLLNDSLLVTLNEAPFEVPVDIDPMAEVSYLTVVARLDDGRRAEDVLFLNAPQNLARVDVGLVEKLQENQLRLPAYLLRHGRGVVLEPLAQVGRLHGQVAQHRQPPGLVLPQHVGELARRGLPQKLHAGNRVGVHPGPYDPLAFGRIARHRRRRDELTNGLLERLRRLNGDRLERAERVPARPRREEVPHLHGERPGVQESDQRICLEDRDMYGRERVHLPEEGVPRDVGVLGPRQDLVGRAFHVRREALRVSVGMKPELRRRDVDVLDAAHERRLPRRCRGACRGGERGGYGEGREPWHRNAHQTAGQSLNLSHRRIIRAVGRLGWVHHRREAATVGACRRVRSLSNHYREEYGGLLDPIAVEVEIQVVRCQSQAEHGLRLLELVGELEGVAGGVVRFDEDELALDLVRAGFDIILDSRRLDDQLEFTVDGEPQKEAAACRDRVEGDGRVVRVRDHDVGRPPLARDRGGSQRLYEGIEVAAALEQGDARYRHHGAGQKPTVRSGQV